MPCANVENTCSPAIETRNEYHRRHSQYPHTKHKHARIGIASSTANDANAFARNPTLVGRVCLFDNLLAKSV